MRIRLKPLSEPKNEDMVRVDDERGVAYALVQQDLFWEGDNPQGDIYEALKRGEKLLVELRIIGEE